MNASDLTRMHSADIEAELKKRGHSLASVGRSIGRKRQTVSEVVNHAPEVYMAIAELLSA